MEHPYFYNHVYISVKYIVIKENANQTEDVNKQILSLIFQFTLAETSSNQHSQSGIRPSPHSDGRQSGLSLPPLQYGQQKFSSNNDSIQQSGHRQPVDAEFSNSFEIHREFTGNQAQTLQQTRHGC